MNATFMIANEDMFWEFIRERHAIYERRRSGQPWPWTADRILQQYKFTNVYRELDRTTVWMRDNVTRPIQRTYHGKPTLNEILLLNCAVFRMFGSMEFATAYGKVLPTWNTAVARHLEIMAKDRIGRGEKVFTGAYIVTNMGLTDPKWEVVCRRFIQPIWDNRKTILEIASLTNRLQAVHQQLGQYQGWGGGGFMAYEVVSDLRHTPVLSSAVDVLTWANPGPGALRGLQRTFGQSAKRSDAQRLMQHLMERAPERFPLRLEMREIEHSLCEFDKYCRVKYGEGKPRSLYRRPSAPVPRGMGLAG